MPPVAVWLWRLGRGGRGPSRTRALKPRLRVLKAQRAGPSAQVLLFTGGPCTTGPGQTVGVPLSEPIRSHHDIEKETANLKYMKKAQKHFASVALRASKVGHVFDVFACALDQV